MQKIQLWSYFGIDRAIFYTILQRGWSGMAGVATVVIMVSTTTLVEQGYYYTFSSIFALQVFFELGFFYVLTQMVAHEHGRQSIGSDIAASARNRLGALVRLSVRWYVVVAISFFVCVAIGGWFFFDINEKPNANIPWHLPWLAAVFFFALNLVPMPIIASLEGCGKVAEVALARLVQDIVGYALFWSGLAYGLGLYAVPLLFLGRIFVISSWIFSGTRWIWLKDYLAVGKAAPNAISWTKEIFPFQWRIAISWIFGYFIFSLFTPVIFAYQGAAEAGRMGMTLSILNGINGISLAWMYTKSPRFCHLIAVRQFGDLNSLFKRTLYQSSLVSIIGLLAVNVGIALLAYLQLEARTRFVDSMPLIFLASTFFINHIMGAMSVYLRAFREELLLTLSVFMGLGVGLSTMALGKYYGVEGVTFGYFALTLVVSLPYGVFVFLKKRWSLESEHTV